MSLLSFENVEVQFDTPHGVVRAVDDVSLAIEPGEIVGLIGESGSGKSVLGLAAMRLLPNTARVSGRIVFEGEDLLALPLARMRSIRGRGIGLIPQNPGSSLNPTMRIGQQVAEGLSTSKSADRDARALLVQMGLDDSDAMVRQFPFMLSGGMRQRVLTAIGIAGQPRLIIADEPTKGLDAELRQQVAETLEQAAAATGAAMLVITHDLQLARKLCHSTHVMREGRIIEGNDTRALFDAPSVPYTRVLIAAQPALLPPRPAQAVRPSPLVSGEKLSKSFGSRNPFRPAHKAVQEADLIVGRGETLGLIGASGCGKSTLGRLLLRLLPIDSGTVRVEGQDITRLGAQAMKPLRRRLQILFQHPDAAFNPRFRLIDSIAEPAVLHRLTSAAEARATARATAEELGLRADMLERYPHQVSGGQLQRLALVRALLLKPEFMVLDEPTSMLDVSIQAQVIAELQKIQASRGIGYLFITHDLDLAAHFSHRIAVMRNGEIVETGRADDIRKAPQHPYTCALVAAFDGFSGRKSSPMTTINAQQGHLLTMPG